MSPFSKGSIPIFLVMLAVAIGMTACDAQAVTGNSLDTQILIDDAVITDLTASSSSLLVTQSGVELTNVQWFCSVFNSEEFIARLNLKFSDDGTGMVRSQPTLWSISEESALIITVDSSPISILGISFNSNNFQYDKFTGKFSDGSDISCDWSGDPRAGSVPFSDPGVYFDETVLDGEAQETVEAERLLITANTQGENFAIWQCKMIDSVGAIDYIDFVFLANNRGEAVLPFEWYPRSESEIQINYGVAEYRLSNIKFTGDNRTQFSADDSRGFTLSCDWFGPLRASVYGG